MDERAMQRALLATARIAGVVTLVGCGSARSGAPVASPTPSEEVASEEVAAQPADTEVSEVADTDPMATCEVVLGELKESMRPKLDEDEKTCCTTYVEQLEAGEGALVEAFPDLRWTCCFGIERQSPSMACTPWGPPAPPAMA